MKHVEVGPGTRARLHLALLRGLAAPLALAGSRGTGRLADLVGRAFGEDGYVVVRPFGGAAEIELGLADGYWMRHVLSDHPYEPDLHALLARLLAPEVAFVDCGANIGWWSVFAATRVAGGNAVAVEASAWLFGRLEANARRNGGAFAAVHAAVWEESGVELRLATEHGRHAWGSVDPEIRDRLVADGFSSEPVQTVTVDDLVDRHTTGTQRYTIAKLDVEGAEIAALRGSASTISRGGVIVFEDHGRDPSATITQFVMDDLELAVFVPTSTGSLRPLDDIETVRRELRDPFVGYNFVACRRGSPGHDALVALG